ncbi:olefin beta-lactone synthetase [Psychromonas sp. SR45-3]|uniref:olefin beta-lactone synthetase n=1 Tax=Psychromonas sp. SR45-3 TaxID=2760930 RepID=UPI0015F96E16|nr:fatty acid CoA ligase family protein [Psychromonas sp. SR45-3]MBB1272094.1 AMP-binding protein [Psychromonas sp. SR45-3]
MSNARKPQKISNKNQNNKQGNLCRHLVTASKKFPENLAVSVQKKTIKGLTYQQLTFAELHQQSDDIAYALNQWGLKAGDKAVLMVTPSIAFFNLTFALFKAGIIPILVDPGMGVNNLKQCFEESQPDAFIGIPKAHLARLIFSWGKQTIKHIINVNGPAIFGGIQLSSILKKYPRAKHYSMQQLNPHQLAAILFTSGSTGTPKGVVYSHSMFEAQISVLKNDYKIQPGEADLATFPLFSLFGPALGMASIVPDMDASQPIKANPNYIFAAIEKYQCSNLFANPALLDVLGQAGQKQQHTLSSIKRVISAGAPASLDAINLFSRMLSGDAEVINSYGATESLPISKIGSQQLLTTTNITEQGGGICVGHAIEHVDIKIIKNTEQNINTWHQQLILAPFEIGEIVVKGPQVSAAYYHRQQATKQAKIKDGNGVRHRMGDLGYLDDQGKLWMCGRKAHQVLSNHLAYNKPYYSIPCERIFNTHKSIKRSALVTVVIDKKVTPAICIEVESSNTYDSSRLFHELQEIAKQHTQTQGIELFYIHKKFPMDIRHNAKIFREKLAVWAQQQIE